MAKSARDILREVSAEQGWTPETEISVLCDFLDWVASFLDECSRRATWDKKDMADRLRAYLKERSA